MFNREKMENPLVRDVATGYKMPRAPRNKSSGCSTSDASSISRSIGKELIMASIPDKNEGNQIVDIFICTNSLIYKMDRLVTFPSN